MEHVLNGQNAYKEKVDSLLAIEYPQYESNVEQNMEDHVSVTVKEDNCFNKDAEFVKQQILKRFQAEEFRIQYNDVDDDSDAWVTDNE